MSTKTASSLSPMLSTTKDDEKICPELLRDLLPHMQPQEGTPANTFTSSELEALRQSLPNAASKEAEKILTQIVEKISILDPSWSVHPKQNAKGCDKLTVESEKEESEPPLWYGAPLLDEKCMNEPRKFREEVRAGRFCEPTNAQCPGFLQCNLVVLPQGQHAFDFLLFCQRNKKACPLIEVCDVGSPHPKGIAKGADLRTDVPKYAIYKDGVLVKEMTDVTDVWPENSVAFLIGCSFSYDGALLDAKIPLRSAEQKKNVPMYNTNLKCRSSGCLSGNMVVSMKPISAMDVAKEVEITSKFPHAHGGPVCIGRPDSIGIPDLNNPDWGDAIELRPDEIPVFHACGVTPQSILMNSKVPFAITHSAGYMFVSDLPADKVP